MASIPAAGSDHDELSTTPLATVVAILWFLAALLIRSIAPGPWREPA